MKAFFCLFVSVFSIACLLLLSSPVLAADAGEQARIDALLEEIGKRQDLVFIRNGSEHSAQEAVNHLRTKLHRAGKKIRTAEQFIDYLATASYISGKPYMIRRQGQAPEPAGPYLHKILQELRLGN